MDHTLIKENDSRRTVLGRYELLGQIGKGGFSTVYRAFDHKMGREVAVKAVRRTEELTDRAAVEARAVAKLGHPHIVTVFELAEDEYEVYIVSELVRGRSLLAAASAASLSDRDCLVFTLQVLEGLDHAHLHGVIHRDIKPDNIMIDESVTPAQAKVMDFGIAQLENTQRITRRGDVVGTLSYMSPEQADGHPVDGSTDVYSAALTLYACLAGGNPFKSQTAAETIARIHAGAPPLARVRPDLPPVLSELLAEAMNPDPRLRLHLEGLADGLWELIGELPDTGQATAVMRRADRPRSSAYSAAAQRLASLAPRAANAGLAALIAAPAALSDFYPAAWQIPLIAGAAAAVALLPRVGLIALAGVALLPVAAWSAALGALLAAAATLYYLSAGLLWTRLALLPSLAPGLAALGLGLAYPAIAGSLGRIRRGLVLALAGGVAMTLFQLLSGSEFMDYLGIANSFGVREQLAGQYNPVAALDSIAAPFRLHPELLLQPLAWLAAAAPAALMIRGRNLWLDFSGLFLSNMLLAAGYFAIPQVAPAYLLDEAGFLKTLLVCVIIQVVLLLVSPRIKLLTIPPRERT